MSEPKTLAQQLVHQIKKRIADIYTIDSGVVTAIKLQTGTDNVERYVVDVVLRDSGDITSYTPNPKPEEAGLRFEDVPIISPYRGKEFGLYIMPKLGQTVLLAFKNKQLEDPVVIGMSDLWFDDTQKIFVDAGIPPTGTVTFKGGELLLYHESGSWIKMDNEGNIQIKSTKGLKVFNATNHGMEVDETGNVILRGTTIDHTQSGGST